MRTELRLPETCGVVSTRMIAFPALLIEVKLLDIYGKIQGAHEGQNAGPHAPPSADQQTGRSHWSDHHQ
jgi:hypothetical protein